MRTALEDIAYESCKVARPGAGDIVIDIGCNDGTLLRSYKTPRLKLVGFEPAKNLVQQARQGTGHVFNNFFGFELFRKEFPRSKAKIITSIAMFYDLETNLFSKKPSIYATFANNIRRIRSQLSKFIGDEVSAGKRIYVYGASTRGNTILQYCGLDHRLIRKATDANPEKWGLSTPGTNIPIVSKREARSDNPEYFLVLPHHFLEEIRKEESEYLQSVAKFIVPLPQFQIVTE